MSKKTSRALLIGAGILTMSLLGVASAVSLGIEANNELGAGVSVTATCQPTTGAEIVVGFDTPTYVPATQGFTVSSVHLSSVDPDCTGNDIKIVVANAAGTAIGTYTGTVTGTTVSATLPAAIDSELVASVSVVIYDN